MKIEVKKLILANKSGGLGELQLYYSPIKQFDIPTIFSYLTLKKNKRNKKNEN